MKSEKSWLAAKPRSLFSTVTRPRPPSSWKVKHSIFKNYQTDTEKLLDQCLEFDWSCSQLGNFI